MIIKNNKLTLSMIIENDRLTLSVISIIKMQNDVKIRPPYEEWPSGDHSQMLDHLEIMKRLFLKITGSSSNSTRLVIDLKKVPLLDDYLKNFYPNLRTIWKEQNDDYSMHAHNLLMCDNCIFSCDISSVVDIPDTSICRLLNNVVDLNEEVKCTPEERLNIAILSLITYLNSGVKFKRVKTTDLGENVPVIFEPIEQNFFQKLLTKE